MLMRRTAAPYIFFAIILCNPVHCVATATALFVSDQGIAIATDSRVVGNQPCPQEIDKILIVKNRFAIAALGNVCLDIHKRKMIGEIVISDTPMFQYEFGAWIREVDSGLPNGATFEKFCEVIKLKLAELIPGLQAVVTAGQVDPQEPNNRFEPFMEFVLLGYTDMLPNACVIQLYIDWQTGTVLEPFQSKVLNLSGKQRSGHFGISKAAAHICNRESYAYKQAMTLCPKALVDFREWKSSITLNEAIALARTSIQIEEKIDPDNIGGQIRVYALLPSGRAYEVSASEVLPKPHPMTKQKQ